MNTRTRSFHVVLAILLSLGSAGRATVFYVSPDGDDSTGTNWATAFTSLESALDRPEVQAGDEIRVRRHSYKPQTTIAVDKAVHIFGGYSGQGLERNAATNITAIDGSNWLSRCLHVTADATFDGLWIVNGYCVSYDGQAQCGAGMYIEQCRPKLHNCTFQGHYAAGRGAAVYAVGADGAEIEDSRFVANSAGEAGGAIYCDNSALSLTDCTFVQNKALNGALARGGALYNETCAPAITDCTFSGNGAGEGAAIYNEASDASLVECTFTGGDLTSGHGGVYNYASSVTMRDCLFHGNELVGHGAAIYEDGGGSSVAINCILRNNYAGMAGGAIFVDGGSTPTFTNCTIFANVADSLGGAVYNRGGAPTVTNCIIWDNYAEMGGAALYDQDGESTVNYCDVQGTAVYPGTGNILAEPGFVAPVDDDMSLAPGSPCIDVGSNDAPHVPYHDFAGDPRIVDGDLDGTAVIDMGAYEFQGGGIEGHIKQINIYEAAIYTEPNDTEPTYLFILEVLTDPTVHHVDFLSGAGQSFTIPNDPNTSSDGVQTYHDDWGDVHAWKYWAGSDDLGDLSQYGDGNYLVVVRHHDGSSSQTSVWYGSPDSATEPVARPTQKPRITAPVPGAVVASPATVQWEPCTDPNVGTIHLAMINLETGGVAVSDTYEVNAVESKPYALGEAAYSAELSFQNVYSVQNQDDIPFGYGKVSIGATGFTVIFSTVYRFWSPVTGRHFYTVDQAERDKLIDQYAHVWTYEGPAFKAFSAPFHPDMAPVYRFWSDASSSHFYTIDEAEKDWLIAEYSGVWTFEGEAFYAFPEGKQLEGAKPVYRFWNAADNTHFFTMDEDERSKLIDEYSHVYTDEGVAFYAYP